MVPSRFHVPPKPLKLGGLSHSVCCVPSARSIFFSLPPAANAIERLSGDQKGKLLASSVPGSGRAVKEPSGRNQICLFPSTKETKTRLWPSGEIASWLKPATFSG